MRPRWRASLPWLGVNFWSRAGGPRMWSSATTPASCARSSRRSPPRARRRRARSASGPTSSPSPSSSTRPSPARFADFLDAHLETGMRTIPTLLVGHMSGENWDPPWRGGPGPVPRRLARLAAGVARRGARAALRPPPGGLRLARLERDAALRRPGHVDEITAWARIVVQALRSGGADQPVSLGDGAWGIEIDGRRQRLLAARARAARRLRRPALVPDAGRRAAPGRSRPRSHASSPEGSASPSCSRSSASPPTSPPTTTPPRTTGRCCTRRCSPARSGWLAWCNADSTTLRGEDPYRHHVFELHFGLTDSDGRPKEPARACCASSRALVRDLAEDGWEPESASARARRPRALRARAAVHRAGVSRATSATTCSRRTSAAREADLPGRARARAGRARDRGAPASRAVREAPHRAGPRAAATSSSGGARCTSRTSPAARRTSAGRGCRGSPSCSASSIGSGTASSTRSRTTSVMLELVADLGELTTGTRLAFAVAGEPRRARYLPVEPADAEVVAIDSYGRPALLRNRARRGPGRPLHVSARAHGRPDAVGQPREHVAASTPRSRRSRESCAACVSTTPACSRGVLHGGTRDTAVFVNCSSVGGLARARRSPA